jgi:tagatose 6-phosphate kinase
MIVTVTLNAALDRTLVAPGFEPGQSRTADRALLLGGGKGLNVTRALRGLGCEVLALGLAGGTTGTLIRRGLDEEDIPHDLTPIRGESRTCTAIIDPERGVTTEINEPGPTVEAFELATFLERFDQALARARLVVLSGSLPAGVPDDVYARLIGVARRFEIPCLLDSRGGALREGLKAQPLIAKPNLREATELLGEEFDPSDRAVHYRIGASLAAITLGSKGAVLHSPIGSWLAVPPVIQPIDAVGAGDCFVAGLCAALMQASDNLSILQLVDKPDVLESALRLATAAATANTLTIGAGRFLEKDLHWLKEEIRIQRIA